MLTRRRILGMLASAVPAARALAAILKSATLSHPKLGVREAMGQGVATRGAGETWRPGMIPRIRMTIAEARSLSSQEPAAGPEARRRAAEYGRMWARFERERSRSLQVIADMQRDAHQRFIRDGALRVDRA